MCKLIPFYNVEVKKNKIKILVFSSFIPLYIAKIILSLFSSVYFLAIIAFYGFYILYCGIEKFIKVPEKHVMIFFIISSLIIVGFYLVLYFVIINPFFKFII
jgi:hypothetical protein